MTALSPYHNNYPVSVSSADTPLSMAIYVDSLYNKRAARSRAAVMRLIVDAVASTRISTSLIERYNLVFLAMPRCRTQVGGTFTVKQAGQTAGLGC